MKLQREVMSAETALEQKRMARHNLLLACKVQSLPVTLLSGSLDEVSEVQVRRRIFIVSSESQVQLQSHWSLTRTNVMEERCKTITRAIKTEL